MPAESALTKPDVLLIVATDGVVLDHTPLAVASVSVVVLPAQMVVVPPIAATVGNVLTVMFLVREIEPQLLVKV